MELGLVLVWFAAYALIAALALPLTAALFSRFPGNGAGFALPLGIATIAMTAYYVGRIAFGLESFLAGLVVLGVASGIAYRRGVEVDRRAFVEAMAVFGAAFLFMVVIRAVDPAVHAGGGEKFLDFGLLAGLYRAETLPPEDVWFAGRRVAYYYGGHMVAALLAKGTFTPPRYAYNLALPGFYGLLVTGVYTLAGAVADELGVERIAAGAIAAVLVGLASNLVTPLRFLAWAFSGVVPGISELVSALGVELNGLADGPQHFSYWPASRVIDGAINEFPFFAYINGDMHAHMMSKGFLLLGAGLLYSYWRTPGRERALRGAVLFVCLPLLAGLIAITSTWSLPTICGLTLLAVAFAPERPLSLLPAVGPLASPDGTGTDGDDPGVPEEAGTGTDGDDPGVPEEAGADREVGLPIDLAEETERVIGGLLVAGVVGVLGAVLVSPFFATSTSSRSLALVERPSGLWELLVVHGGFLVVTLPYLAYHLDPGNGRRRVQVVATVVLLAAALVAIPLVPVGAVLFVPLLPLAWALLRTSDDVSFETALIVGVFGLVTIVEFVYVTRAGRFNTVFKTYSQVWALWGTGVGVMIARHANPLSPLAAVVSTALDAVRQLEGGEDRPTPDGGARRSGARDGAPGSAGGSAGGPSRRELVAGGLVVVLLLSLSLYPGLALAEHATVNDGSMTLDATRFVDRHHTTEAGAIAWLRTEVDGQPNMVSMPTRCLYRWSDDGIVEQYADDGPTDRATPCSDFRVVGGSAPSSLTGVPTVAGWSHEVGYRGREPFERRVRDVRTIYNGTASERVEMLRQYDVEYVYVGPAEQYRWGNVSFAGLTGVEVAYRDEWVTIYRVDQDELGVASGS